MPSNKISAIILENSGPIIIPLDVRAFIFCNILSIVVNILTFVKSLVSLTSFPINHLNVWVYTLSKHDLKSVLAKY